MPVTCRAPWCKNGKRRNPNISFYRFPKEAVARSVWADFCKTTTSALLESNRLCSDHFENNIASVTSMFPTILVSGISSQTSSDTDRKVKKNDKPTKPELDAPTLKRRREDEKEATITQLRKQLKMEKQKTKRLLIQREKSRTIIEDLRERELLTADGYLAMEAQFSESCLELLKNEMDKAGRTSKTGFRYSDTMKRFAIALHFHSPSAYNFLRESSFALPEERTLRRWRSNVECDAGFHTQALTALSQIASNSNEPIFATLMVDAMAIRKQITWNSSTKCYEGFEDLGDGNKESDNKTPAAEALVFMATAINDRWKVPIGYFLINGISGEQQAGLTREALHHLHEAGVNVVAFVADGCTTNHSTASHLGCNLLANQLRGTFPHPSTGKDVAFLFDVCHMLKLVRNTFASEGKLYLPPDDPQTSTSKKVIDWGYVEYMHKIQQAEGLRITNRVRASHMNWQAQKMKVALAAQTLSSSVGVSLKYLKRIAPAEFGSSNDTADWILDMDRLFDILNSKNCAQGGFKAPIRLCNQHRWRPFLTKMRKMLLKLEDSKGRKLCTGPKKTAYIGLCLAIDAVFHLADTLLATHKMQYLLTYKISQDHLELFFCSVRGRGGWNNNPSVAHFKASWRTLLLNNRIKPKSSGNCVAQDETHLLDIVDVSHYRRANHTDSDNDGYILDQDEPMDYPDLTTLAENICCYLCGYIVRQELKRPCCPDCKIALVDAKPTTSVDMLDDEDYRVLLLLKDNGGPDSGLTMPSHGVFLIGKECERVFRGAVGGGAEEAIDAAKLTDKNLLTKMEIRALRNLEAQTLFPGLEEHALDCEVGINNHFNRLIRRVITRYLTIRLHEFSKIMTEKLKKSNLRKKLSKLVLFNNQ